MPAHTKLFPRFLVCISDACGFSFSLLCRKGQRTMRDQKTELNDNNPAVTFPHDFPCISRRPAFGNHLTSLGRTVFLRQLRWWSLSWKTCAGSSAFLTCFTTTKKQKLWYILYLTLCLWTNTPQQLTELPRAKRFNTILIFLESATS